MKHKISQLLSVLLSFILNLVSPPKCAICKDLLEESGELCPICLEYFAHAMNRRCPICAKTARSCTCRPRYMQYTTELGSKRMLALTYFAKADCTDPGDIAARKLVYAVKKSSSRSCARFAARQLSHELLKFFAKEKLDISKWYITYPPRSNEGIRTYGFDQSKQLVSLISEYTGIKIMKCFKRKKGKMQKLLSTTERKMNADSLYGLLKDADVRDKRFLIIDDVITSGATVNACAALLLHNGAADAFPVCISRMKKKKRLPKRKAPKKLWFR
ncbi:MAG: ComF family protein [Clostridia bacterium]|nr:ComF family protein [Clostridia bacterium]MBQ8474684.1 ComF family protein [Clostridia bacterium]